MDLPGGAPREVRFSENFGPPFCIASLIVKTSFWDLFSAWVRDPPPFLDLETTISLEICDFDSKTTFFGTRGLKHVRKGRRMGRNIEVSTVFGWGNETKHHDTRLRDACVYTRYIESHIVSFRYPRPPPPLTNATQQNAGDPPTRTVVPEL